MKENTMNKNRHQKTSASFLRESTEITLKKNNNKEEKNGVFDGKRINNETSDLISLQMFLNKCVCVLMFVLVIVISERLATVWVLFYF